MSSGSETILMVVGRLATVPQTVAVVAAFFLTAATGEIFQVSTMPLDEPDRSEWAAPCGRAR
jgi:hypothetical protein